MAKILPFLPREKRVSEPGVTRAMSDAFDRSCKDLGMLATDARARELIALRIIALARSGVTEEKDLHRRVVGAHMFMHRQANGA
jgi:hypothetical protein